MRRTKTQCSALWPASSRIRLIAGGVLYRKAGDARGRREASARRRERLEAKLDEDAGASKIPRIRDHETPRLVQLTKYAAAIEGVDNRTTHSLRSARIGSTRAAASAGTRLAASATSSRRRRPPVGERVERAHAVEQRAEDAGPPAAASAPRPTPARASRAPCRAPAARPAAAPRRGPCGCPPPASAGSPSTRSRRRGRPRRAAARASRTRRAPPRRFASAPASSPRPARRRCPR